MNVPIRGKIWRLWWDGQWQATGRDFEYHFPITLQPPAGSVANAYFVHKDREDNYWMMSEGHLYKAAFGKCVRVLPTDEPHPLNDGTGIVDVLIDARGRPLLIQGSDEYQRSMFLPFNPPETTASASSPGDDEWIVRLGSPGKLAPWYRWRLDGGPWSQLQTGPGVDLEYLSSGDHVFEAVAVNQRLEADHTPARAVIEVNTPPQVQVDRLLRLLRSSDFKVRNKVVRALVREPKFALPALRAARQTANDRDGRWIDAAIQAVEPKFPGIASAVSSAR